MKHITKVQLGLLFSVDKVSMANIDDDEFNSDFVSEIERLLALKMEKAIRSTEDFYYEVCETGYESENVSGFAARTIWVHAGSNSIRKNEKQLVEMFKRCVDEVSEEKQRDVKFLGFKYYTVWEESELTGILFVKD